MKERCPDSGVGHDAGVERRVEDRTNEAAQQNGGWDQQDQAPELKQRLEMFREEHADLLVDALTSRLEGVRHEEIRP